MSNSSISLLNEVLDAHGGYDRWREYSGVASAIISGGRLWEIKGAKIIRTPRRATSEFRRQWTRVTPFGNPDWTMTWMPQQIDITDSRGTIVAQRTNGRDAVDRGYDAPWDPLDLAYFNGYAMWTYHAFPFAFAEPDYEAREIASIAHEGELLRGLSIRLPEGVHSHSREQRFYFGSDGLLRRHDYEVDVWANTPAAHLLSDYVDVNGLKFPSRRNVYFRRPDGQPDLNFNLVSIELSDYTLF
jgi:hypothetical protein